MTDDEFDAGLVGAAFALGAQEGWRMVSAAAAARKAGLDLVRARKRFPGNTAIVQRFGALADGYALTGSITEGSVRDRLFDLLLRRFDFLQTHRAGVVALLRHVPLEPALGALLARESLKSMGWLLEGAGVSAQGIRGELRKRGLGAVWAWGVRAWLRDTSEDLSATMAAVDVALNRADQIAARFGLDGAGPAGEGFVPEAADAAPEPEAEGPDAGMLTVHGPDGPSLPPGGDF